MTLIGMFMNKKEKKDFEKEHFGGIMTRKHSSLAYTTGSWKTFIPVVDFKRCINCLMCIAYCPENTIEATKDKEKLQGINLKYCKGCSICAMVCPVKCIMMKKVTEGEAERT